FFFSSRRRHTRSKRDWSSDVCSSDLENPAVAVRRTDQLGQPLGLGEGVVVEQHHIFALGPGNALVHRVGKTGVVAVFDQGEVGRSEERRVGKEWRSARPAYE